MQLHLKKPLLSKFWFWKNPTKNLFIKQYQGLLVLFRRHLQNYISNNLRAMTNIKNSFKLWAYFGRETNLKLWQCKLAIKALGIQEYKRQLPSTWVKRLFISIGVELKLG